MTAKNSKVVGSLEEKMWYKGIWAMKMNRYNWKDKQEGYCSSFPAPSNEGASGC